MTKQLLIAALAFFIQVEQPQAAPAWEALTPGGGGIFTDIACSDQVDGLMYLSSDVASLMRSENYGATWVNVSHGLGSQYIQGIALDPADSNGVYITISDGVYHSSDRGDSWTRLGVTGTDNRSLDRLPGEGIPKNRYATPSDICVVRDGDTNVIYVGTGHLSGDLNSTNKFLVFWVSRDNGATFTNREIVDNNANSLFDGSTPVYSVLSRSAAPHEVWISTGEGIFQSLNYGETWTQKTAGLPHLNARQMMCNYYSTHELAVVLESDGTTDSGVYYFDPSQQKWFNMTGNLPVADGSRKIKYRYLDGDRRSFGATRRPATVIVGSNDSRNDGYYMTTDRGTNWTYIADNDAFQHDPNDGVDSNWFDPAVRGWMIYYNTEGNGEIYIGGDHRILESTDGGATFEDIVSVVVDTTAAAIWNAKTTPISYASHLITNSWSGAGETDDMVIRKVAADPFNPDNIFVCVADNVLFRSQDRGVTWRQIKLRLRSIWTGDSHSAVFDPDTPDTVYALASTGYSSNHGEGAIFCSTNGGNSWDILAGSTNRIGGLPGHEMHELVFGPTNAYGNRKMFVSLFYTKEIYGDTPPAGHESGIYESSDGGTSWSFVGLTNAYVRQITINPEDETELLAGVTGGPYNGVCKLKYDNGSWSETNVLSSSSCWNVHAANGTTVYAAMVDGLYRSWNAGNTWSKLNDPAPSQAGSGDAKYFGICTDPAAPNKLYISRFGNNPGIWRSSDNGNTWKDITFGHDNPRAMWLLRADSIDNGVTNRWLYSATQGNGLHRFKLRDWE